MSRRKSFPTRERSLDARVVTSEAVGEVNGKPPVQFREISFAECGDCEKGNTGSNSVDAFCVSSSCDIGSAFNIRYIRGYNNLEYLFFFSSSSAFNGKPTRERIGKLTSKCGGFGSEAVRVEVMEGESRCFHCWTFRTVSDRLSKCRRAVLNQQQQQLDPHPGAWNY